MARFHRRARALVAADAAGLSEVRPQKSCAQPLGDGWARANRSGTGRGGDVTGRVSLSFVSTDLLLVPCAGGGDRRLGVAERDPDIRIALRLALDEAVAGLRPGNDVLVLIVENELALVCLRRQHRVSFALLVANDGDEQGLARPSGIDQHLALQ